jgi:hypothetical protein
MELVGLTLPSVMPPAFGEADRGPLGVPEVLPMLRALAAMLLSARCNVVKWLLSSIYQWYNWISYDQTVTLQVSHNASPYTANKM